MLKVQCPGRINIIGEHTDYSEGYVLPACINKYVMMEFVASTSWKFYAEDLDQSFVLEGKKLGWVVYFEGVLKELQLIGIIVKPMHIAFRSTIPIGAGLSSSSAITVAFLYGLNLYNHLGLTQKEMAQLAQKAEWHSGVKGGIMDQYAMLFGQANRAMFLDCLHLEHRYIDCNLIEKEWLLLNTNVPHKLSDSSYNDRKKVCHAGLNSLLNKFGLANHQDINRLSVEDLKRHLVGDELSFVRYLWEENKRVFSMSEALHEQAYFKIGTLLFAGHHGLSHDYRVSCPELDFLVSAAKNHDQIYGSRMVGGGFGGCTLQLVEEGSGRQIYNEFKDGYKDTYGLDLDYIVCKVVGGVKEVDTFITD